MKKIFAIFSILLVFACTTRHPVSEIDQRDLTEKELIELLLTDDFQEDNGFDNQGLAVLRTFYEQRNYKPLWCTKKALNDTLIAIIEQLRNPIAFGLSERRMHLVLKENFPIQNEMAVVHALAKSYKDLHYGMIDSTGKSLKQPNFVSAKQLDTLLNFTPGNVAQKIISWGPQDSTYQILANYLYDYCTTNSLIDEPLEIATMKEDTILAIKGTKEKLLRTSYLDSTNVNDSLQFIKELKKFQQDNGLNPDGVIGESTVRALKETKLHKAQRLSIAMEKHRTTRIYPEKYIEINIPEYALRFHNADSLAIETRVVVGKFENQTPELNSNLHTIVVYPFWTVPYSISSKEILPAAQKNANYFEKNDMILLRKGDTIDPQTVKWSTIKEDAFPYKVKQLPGKRNSLGILKFDFNNKFDVYVHDTPSKGLFNTTARAYSHGCIRTENPVDFAKVILELDENKMTVDSLDTLIGRYGQNYFLKLRKSIPIYITYQTIKVVNDQPVIFRDVYLRDEQLIKLVFGI